jgi:hypothetical protein
MRLSGTCALVTRVLVVAGVIGLMIAEVGAGWRAPQLDSMIVADGLADDRRITPPPAVIDTLGERIAPDRQSHRVLVAMVFSGVGALLVLRRGVLGLLSTTPRIRGPQHSPHQVRAPPLAGLSF